jgi:thiol-disulfide isomerase/thioredoxin
MKQRQTWVLAVGLLLLVATSALAREWTNDTGDFSIEADLVEAKNGTVKLKKQNGKIITVPVSKLSKADREYLATVAEAKQKPAAQSTAERLKANPNDVKLIAAYMQETVQNALGLMNSNPAAAKKQLDEMDTLFASLKPKQALAKQVLRQVRTNMSLYRQRVEQAQKSMDDLIKRLGDNPDDVRSLSLYVKKVTSMPGFLTSSDPEQAEKQVAAAKAFLTSLRKKAQRDATKKQIDGLLASSFSRLEQRIEGGKKLLALIGTDAASLDGQTKAWVNGEAITDADLKGKVVLLDFWAVWCGPCIATFPDLCEWNEKYADKGLVMIGITDYHNYKWNEANGRAERSRVKVSPADEQAMIEKFCKKHKLQHRMVFQSGGDLSSSYAVTGIPHVVVIDREGKVRMIRSGYSTQSAKEIGELLERLVGG